MVLNHPLDAVRRVLSILEAVEFRWTVAEVLAQDDAWMDDILTAKSVGEKWKRIREGKKR